MSVPLRVLIVTDSFPPGCGGSGWSTWELSQGLVSRGHHVEVVKVEAGNRTGVFKRTYEGLKVTDFCRPAVNVPVIRNVLKNERLWSTAAEYLTRRLKSGDFDIVHAPARPDDRALDSCRRGDRHAGRRHGARLLARLLLVRSHLRPGAARSSVQAVRPR